MSKQNHPLTHSPHLSWLKACQWLEENGEAYCIATIVAEAGSVPRSAGSKMVISQSHQFDTLGGGNLELQVINRARKALAQGEDQLQIERFSLAADLQQCCGGATQVMFEYFNTQQPKVVIFGAGHVGYALSTILKSLPCKLTVVDSRQQWLTPINELGVNTVLTKQPIEFLDSITSKSANEISAESPLQSLDSNTYLLIMTHDHNLDFELARAALEQDRFAFIGLIGSQGKKRRFEFRLKEQLSHPKLVDNLTCPIGLQQIEGKLPMQIAVSVSAQLIELFNQSNSLSRLSPQPYSSQPTESKNGENDQTNQVQWNEVNQLRSSIKEEKQ